MFLFEESVSTSPLLFWGKSFLFILSGLLTAMYIDKHILLSYTFGQKGWICLFLSAAEHLAHSSSVAGSALSPRLKNLFCAEVFQKSTDFCDFTNRRKVSAMVPLCSVTFRAQLLCYETRPSYTEVVNAKWKALAGKTQGAFQGGSMHNECVLQTIWKLNLISIRACHSVHNLLYVFLTDTWLVSWLGYDLKRERKTVLKVDMHQPEICNHSHCVLHYV